VPEKPSLESLEETYSSPDFKHALFDLLNISALLSGSIIKKDYQVPPALHGMIALTDYGQQIYDLLRKRAPFHEARLLCFLEMYRTDLMIDVMATDRDGIVDVLNKQVSSRALLFPFIYGRLLYDKYYEEFEDNPQSWLNTDETQRLLNGTPQGIAQFGRLVTGPYGIISAKSKRNIPLGRDVPIRNCSDLSCGAVHHVHLSTNFDAPINKHRETLGKILEREDNSNSAWAQFIEIITAENVSWYQDWASEPIIVLIGDALTDIELRRLLSWIIDHSDGYLRTIAASIGLPGLGDSVTSQMNRAQLLQLIIAEKNDYLVSGIDYLVSSNIIPVPYGEIRKPVVNAATRYGLHGLHAELGRDGVRVLSTGSSIAPLRARRLVEKMYRLDNEADREELDWQMRDEPSDSLDAKLENYLQTKSPRQALGGLVLARRSNVVVATASLGLGEIAGRSDEKLIDGVLWKLGFSIESPGEASDDFWRMNDEMRRHTRQGIIGSNPSDLEKVRGAASSYFTSLERFLDETLAYIIWALITDHYGSPKPFEYRPHIDRMESFRRLNDFDNSAGSAERLTSKNTLAPLCRCFAKLAAYLMDCESRAQEFERSLQDQPEWAAVQSLERFPFQHKMAFLDLMPSSRATIIRVLEEITSRFLAGRVSETRNDWSHGQKQLTTSSLDTLREAVERVREAVLTIDEYGFSRQQYRRTSDVIDGDNRRTSILASPSGRQVSLFGPSPFAWLRLPALSDPQYVMTSARFAEPAECLRFTIEAESPYSQMWNDYPRRPRLQRGRTVAGQSAVPSVAQTAHV
jgi:hypothetical protein